MQIRAIHVDEFPRSKKEEEKKPHEEESLSSPHEEMSSSPKRGQPNWGFSLYCSEGRPSAPNDAVADFAQSSNYFEQSSPANHGGVCAFNAFFVLHSRGWTCKLLWLESWSSALPSVCEMDGPDRKIVWKIDFLKNGEVVIWLGVLAWKNI